MPGDFERRVTEALDRLRSDAGGVTWDGADRIRRRGERRRRQQTAGGTMAALVLVVGLGWYGAAAVETGSMNITADPGASSTSSRATGGATGTDGSGADRGGSASAGKGSTGHGSPGSGSSGPNASDRGSSDRGSSGSGPGSSGGGSLPGQEGNGQPRTGTGRDGQPGPGRGSGDKTGQGPSTTPGRPGAPRSGPDHTKSGPDRGPTPDHAPKTVSRTALLSPAQMPKLVSSGGSWTAVATGPPENSDPPSACQQKSLADLDAADSVSRDYQSTSDSDTSGAHVAAVFGSDTAAASAYDTYAGWIADCSWRTSPVDGPHDVTVAAGQAAWWRVTRTDSGSPPSEGQTTSTPDPGATSTPGPAAGPAAGTPSPDAPAPGTTLPDRTRIAPTSEDSPTPAPTLSPGATSSPASVDSTTETEVIGLVQRGRGLAVLVLDRDHSTSSADGDSMVRPLQDAAQRLAPYEQ